MEIHRIFYIDEKKIPSRYRKVRSKKIVPNDIYNLLTPLAFYHWVMSSGIKIKGRGLKLYIDNDFNIIDAVKLINVLIVKYRLNCTILSEGKPLNNKDGLKNNTGLYRLVIYIYRSSLSQIEKFIKGVFKKFFSF